MNQPKIAAIACQDLKGGIGLSNGDLPWGKHKEDMAFFKQTTLNSVCIMGRKTYEGIAKYVQPNNPLLKNRECIVLMSDPGQFLTNRTNGFYKLPYTNMHPINGIQTAIGYAKYAISFHNDASAAQPLNDTIFFIGGRSIYEQAVPYIDTLYLNRIERDYNADIKFPHDAYKSFRLKTATHLATDLVSLTLKKDENV